MRTSITFKLFLALLATAIVMALAMGAAVRYSFDRGFDDYMREREHQRLSALAESLATAYADAGDWQFLNERHSRWGHALRLLRREPDRLRRSPTGKADGPPARVTLLDADGRWLAGNPTPPTQPSTRVAVQLDDATIGWLLGESSGTTVFSDEVDQRFQARQFRATWAIVGLSVLLAMLASLWLARVLLAPVRRIARATHQLASGDYATRVPAGARDDLGRLARDFNLLAHSLERNERLRREWMADMSHELRTPLAVLRAEIEALQDGLRPMNAATLASLEHEVGHLNQLIDDLYELSLADAGALNYHWQTLDLSALVNRGIDLMRERFTRAGLQLTVQVAAGQSVRGDERRLAQLVANLLENSLRYTDAPGTIRVRLSGPAGAPILEVADSAPGVDAERLPHLFDRLYRAEPSRSRQHGGAGLGLALCRHIAQAHGATLSAQASDLGGLCITLAWPDGPATPAA